MFVANKIVELFAQRQCFLCRRRNLKIHSR